MENYIIYGGTKYKAKETVCENCGKVYLAAERWLLTRKHHYCCKQCAIAGRSRASAQAKQELWDAEKHYCECCGKEIKEKFGSGRFCSRACANKRIASDKQRSIASKLRTDLNNAKTDAAKLIYNEAPQYCQICGTKLDYKHRNLQTCSNICYKQLQAQHAKVRNLGGVTNSGGPCSRRGYYHGIHCDSTYELIYLIYCLENNIKIVRNKKYFMYYNTNNVLRKYYPDFYLPELNTYIELKGYKDGNVDSKLDSVIKAGSAIQILYKDDLRDKLDFINKKLNKNYNINLANIAELYDN